MICTILKIAILGLTDALGIWAIVGLGVAGNWFLLATLIIGMGLLNLALLSRRAHPLRYLIPGLIFFGAMVVYPILYNVSIAFTNYSTGHFLSKEQAIAHFQRQYYLPENTESFSYQAFRSAQGDLILILSSRTTGALYLAMEGHLTLLDPKDPRLLYENNQIKAFEGVPPLSTRELVQNLNRLEKLALPYGEGVVRLASLREFKVYKPRYQYDPDKDTLTDLLSGKVYVPKEGSFTSEDGESLDPGFRVYVGLTNFVRIFSNRQITGPFFRVFRWTFLWAFLSVATTFCLGLALAILLNNPYLRFRYLYRTLLIIPYAIPGFISLLVWRGLLNTNFGVVNQILNSLFHIRIPWLQEAFWAKMALVLVNLWLGYPYMMIVCLGALQSIPSELFEAAYVDGANRWQQFKKITLPLLLISIAPLLVGSFAFNFNNFNVIYLLTEGGPPIPGTQTSAGATDILISYVYKLAFASGRGQEYGFAAAVSIIIFLIVGTISALNFRFTKSLERMSEGL